MNSFASLRFENSYARLHPAFYQVVGPTPLPDPCLVAFNPNAAALLDLDPRVVSDREAAHYLSGARRLPGAEPIAQAYAGHQFGVWVPQLGDGRAFLLGEVRGGSGAKWDLHLKGGGRTRYSRFGDGRSVLRSTVREYLASEALAGLGIPTTRALAIVGSTLPVQRERMESAATLLRLAPSHVRFGTFQYFAARGEAERLRELLDHVIREHFPELAEQPDPRFAWLGEVCRRTARLLAQWMASGFAHGVMNTDNMSVLGITLDYGPYGFMDRYDGGFICNHSDLEGRYAFDQQPAVGLWNCTRLAEALSILTADVEAWRSELAHYWPAFDAEYLQLMRRKLGLRVAFPDDTDDKQLIVDLLGILQADHLDYSGFFRGLADHCVNGQQSTVNSHSETMRAWLQRYEARLHAEGSSDAERAPHLKRVNPRYVLRNWVAQEAIEEAEQGRFGLIEELRQILANPFDEHPGKERFAQPPSSDVPEIFVSCSS